jgi:hypothetical protein
LNRATLETPRVSKVMPTIFDQPAIPFIRYASVRIYIGCQGWTGNGQRAAKSTRMTRCGSRARFIQN